MIAFIHPPSGSTDRQRQTDHQRREFSAEAFHFELKSRAKLVGGFNSANSCVLFNYLCPSILFTNYYDLFSNYSETNKKGK